MDETYSYKHLTAHDTASLKGLLQVFADAFNEPETYLGKIPNDAYLESFLTNPHNITLIALNDEEVVGGLVAYVLEKFEQNRREIYIYDLAVSEVHRRKGIATHLINDLKQVAKEKDAYVIYVQADYGDDAAIHLYESMGTKEEVLHFDINVK